MVDDRTKLPGRRKEEYLALRRRYHPHTLKLVVIAESPPASGQYFYDPTGTCTEPLFRAFMRQLNFSCSLKEEGLLEFQRRGAVLIDATYIPVNRLTDPERDKAITQDYPSLREDLLKITPDRSIPLVLIKANVCKLLEPKLTKDGFNVINRSQSIYFPSTGQQTNFHRQFAAVLEKSGIQLPLA